MTEINFLFNMIICMFALSGDSRPLGENDDVGGVLEERWRKYR